MNKSQLKSRVAELEELLNFKDDVIGWNTGRIKELKEENHKYKRIATNMREENDKLLGLLEEFNKFIDYKLSIHPGSLIYRDYRESLDKLNIK